MTADHPLRVVFMGTPDFAIPVLSSLMDAGHDIAGVYTRPDKPTGRGKRASAPPIKQYAVDRGLQVFQPASLRTQRVQDELATLSPDLIAVAAYGLFLPTRMLSLPPLGALNVHPSLLPKYRGPSPVASAILTGESVTGVTVMKIDERMDSGPVVARRETSIGRHEGAESLTARLFQMGAFLLVEVLPGWAQGKIHAQPQDELQATTAKRLSKQDGEIDWRLGAELIARQVRAYQPWPASFTRWGGKLLKIIEASAAGPEGGAPSPAGRVTSRPGGGIAIACGEGVLEVGKLQLEGRRAIEAPEFAQGYPDIVGSTVGS